MTKFIATFTIVFITLFTTAIASAQEDYTVCHQTQTPPAVVELAKQKFQEGASAYGNKNFILAVASWKEAYRLDCTASLLLHHISRAYRELGEYEAAFHALQAYVDYAGTTLTDAEKKIIDEERTLLEARIDKQAVKSEQQQAERKDAQLVAAIQTASQPKPLPTETKRSHVIPTVLIIGGGAVAFGGGLYFADRLIKKGQLEDQCPDRECESNALANEGNSVRKQGNVGLTVMLSGFAIATAGVTWLVLDSKGSAEQPKTARIQPWIGTNSGGVNYSGTF